MSVPIITSYGSWESPISSDMIVSSGLTLGQIVLDGEAIYWSEGRPAENGRSGQRYILATEQSYDFPSIFDIAREFVPDLQTPRRLPKSILMVAATMQELTARLTGSEPLVSRSQVNLYYGKVQTMNINKARQELSYAPRTPEQALRESFTYLLEETLFAQTPPLQIAGA